jgi:hypothetical protein
VFIVHEARPETDEFDRARKAFQGVDQVVMLGFGYGATNLSRLDLHRWKRGVSVFGTAYGLTRSRITHDVESPFQKAGINVALGEHTHGTREFLENRLEIFRR